MCVTTRITVLLGITTTSRERLPIRNCSSGARDDDVYEPTYLERCVAELDERPELVACHSRVGYINERGEELMRSFRQLHFDDDRPWVRFEQVLGAPT